MTLDDRWCSAGAKARALDLAELVRMGLRPGGGTQAIRRDTTTCGAVVARDHAEGVEVALRRAWWICGA